MAEMNVDLQDQEELPKDADKKEEQEASDIEQRAREQGWRPKEEFEGDKSRWVSAETFIAKGELIDRIESIGKELKNTKKAMAMLQDHHKQVKEAEFTRAVNFLKQQKKQAYESGDIDKIIDIDEQIATVKETQTKQTEILQKQSGDSEEGATHPEFTTWVSENRWYNNDGEMRELADSIGIAHAKSNPNKTPQEVLEYVAKKIRATYPEKFTNQNRTRPSTVEGGQSNATQNQNSSKGVDINMSEEEIKVMNTFVRQGIMSKEEYMKELKAIKGVQ